MGIIMAMIQYNQCDHHSPHNELYQIITDYMHYMYIRSLAVVLDHIVLITHHQNSLKIHILMAIQ